MPSSVLSSMMSGMSSNFTGLNQTSPYSGGNASKTATATATAQQQQQSTPSPKKPQGNSEGNVDASRRSVFYDSDTSAIEGLMLMKSAQIPQSDGSAGLSSLVSAVQAPAKKPRTGDYDFKPTEKEERP